jgi:hypothetical protein
MATDVLTYFEVSDHTCGEGLFAILGWCTPIRIC